MTGPSSEPGIPARWLPPTPQYPPANYSPIPLPVHVPVPPRPTGPRRPRAMLFVSAGLAVLLALVCSGLAIGRFSASHSPGTVAKRYFSALSDGNAPAALALADSAPTNAPFLTSTVLKQQQQVAKLSDVTVASTSQDGSTATVYVSYTLNFASQQVPISDQVPMVKDGSSWRLSKVAATVSLSASSAGADRLTFAGRPIPGSDVQVFPGALPVATDSAAVAVTNHPSVPLKNDSSPATINVDVAGPVRTQIIASVDAALTRCLAASSTDPLCPMVSGDRPVPGSLHGKLSKTIADSDPKVTLSVRGKGAVDFAASVSIDATWKVWDFNNQQVAKSESTTLALKAQTTVDDPKTIVWVTPSA